MSLVPAEGSTYDKVLAWAQLFVERIHSFTEAMEPFAGDSFMAADLAYSYCDMLFEVSLKSLHLTQPGTNDCLILAGQG